MFSLGIHSRAQYEAMGPERRFSGARVAYYLLNVGPNPTAEEIRVFEDVCITLRTSNGTFRTTFRNRFPDIDAAAGRWIEKLLGSSGPIQVQDRAVSSGLTSAEWAQDLFRRFPGVDFEASDLLIELRELSRGTSETWIAEPNGSLLQYIRPPFVVSLYHQESWRNPLLRFVAMLGRRRFAGQPPAMYQERSISCIHPEAQAIGRANPAFRVVVRSVFDRTPGACNVLRTLNILNRSYFTREQLMDGVEAAFQSLRPGGIWIVGRTLEEDFSNHATLFRRSETGWELLERIGNGSEIEQLALLKGGTA